MKHLKNVLVLLVIGLAVAAGAFAIAHSPFAPSSEFLLAGSRLTPDSIVSSGAVFAAGMLLNIGQPLSLAQLADQRRVPTEGFEVFQSSIYDTVTWPAAGVLAGQTLDVFTTTTADETISNLKQAGQIPKPDKFHSRKLFLSPLIEQTADADATTAGIVRDLDRVIFTSRSVLKLTPSVTGKTRPGIPLDQIGGFGGVIAETAGTTGAGLLKAHARLAAIGGHPFDLILDSNEEIHGQFKAGVTAAIVAAMSIRTVLWGYRYQKAG